MKSFNFLSEDSTKKPRTNGLTMVLDKGLGYETAESLMKISGDYVDYLKFGWGTTAIQEFDVVREKVEMYKSFDIKPYVGGTLFEIAFMKSKLDEFFKEASLLGFETIEISDGTINISEDEKINCIKKASNLGFNVLSEVGKKDLVEDSKLDIDSRIDLIKREKEAGSEKIILEARESGKSIGIFDDSGNPKENEVDYILKNIKKNDIIWEAPNKNQQVYFILKIGSDVNLGNISSEDIISLETLRKGLRGDTVGKV
ncbi:phosphosulfolactate synthase [Methanobrevibacter sp. OttesenSCG-928-K11]|nr:phosphosulfolactate synthase [Methanobrevibacter sp. OttesenSCG-928-K11]MDL2270920.1 phosphosulfolactate synthase [Methanobrevibacter sp. OttesenSCG-928-I08]